MRTPSIAQSLLSFIILSLPACNELAPEVPEPSPGSEGTTSAGGQSTSAGTTDASPTTVATSAMDSTDGPSLDTSGDGTSSGPGSTGVAAACGDGAVDPGEDCDDGNAAGSDGCDANCAVEEGWSCDEAQPSVCAGICGDGMVVGDEECDGPPDAGACIAAGFDDGVATCDAVRCTLDTSECVVLENLQNDLGDCSFEIGCSNSEGTFGNPQDALECYTSSLTPPIEVAQLEYLLDDDNIPLPEALDLIVHQWAGLGNPPGPLIGSVPLAPGDIVADGHTLVLASPIEVNASTFCVGFHGEDPADGFRISLSGMYNTGESYLRAPANGCDTFDFTLVSTFSEDGHYCVRPTVTSHTP